ncbi:MAPEG family protein [Roseovarius sp. 2305UL8-3]|uniref:MAPEG family protein n=1 Tax=Roseovarius conchicola TaxID=3121636 RepID=UPI003528CCF8
MEAFAAYGHALVALAATAIFGLLMSPLSAMRKTAFGLAPGQEPAADYGSSVYRWHRAYLNLAESMGFFAAVTVAAILAGGSPFWVNLYASVFFVSRLVMAVIHIRGLGGPDRSLRSMAYAVGMLMCVLLGLTAIINGFAG